MVKFVELSKGKVALVDDEDFERVNQYKWYAWEAGNSWYVSRNTARPNRKKVLLHRFILNIPEGVCIDHINGDGLDCRKENMRTCSHAENMRNRRTPCNNKSGYKGVYWYKKYQKWRASIKIGGTSKHIGYFDNVVEAAKAYDLAAKEYHGAFAKLNY